LYRRPRIDDAHGIVHCIGTSTEAQAVEIQAMVELVCAPIKEMIVRRFVRL
jgi:hypothetical protein